MSAPLVVIPEPERPRRRRSFGKGHNAIIPDPWPVFGFMPERLPDRMRCGELHVTLVGVDRRIVDLGDEHPHRPRLCGQCLKGVVGAVDCFRLQLVERGSLRVGIQSG
jgi:hypothetical protein